MELRRLDFILNQLDRYTGQKKRVGDSTFVTCPYHSERTPSFRIFHSSASKSPGFGKCYGCGQTAKWDELAPKLGLQPFTYVPPTQQFARPILREEKEGSPKVTYTYSRLPEGKSWRGISTALLHDLGGKKALSSYGKVFIYLPVFIKGNLRGHITARMKKEDGRPSYINSSGKWSERYGLFPYDHAVRNRPKVVVLVEGPRDALRLLSYGIPAIAILGTQSWSETKSKLVEMTGAETVILAFDGDDAGLRAIELVRPLLSKLVKVKVFSLTAEDSPYWEFKDDDEPSKAAKQQGVELWDPCSMPLKKVKDLKALIDKYSD